VLAYAAIGSADRIRRDIQAFHALTNPDELIITSTIFDHAARLRSYEITAEVRDSLG